MFKIGGLKFDGGPEGTATVQIFDGGAENSPYVRTVHLSAEARAEILAELVCQDVVAEDVLEETDLDETPGGISTVNSEEAFLLIAAADTDEELDVLEAAEQASQKHPGGRKGVLSALASRREQLNKVEDVPPVPAVDEIPEAGSNPETPEDEIPPAVPGKDQE